jgi:hypothetical protein
MARTEATCDQAKARIVRQKQAIELNSPFELEYA